MQGQAQVPEQAALGHYPHSVVTISDFVAYRSLAPNYKKLKSHSDSAALKALWDLVGRTGYFISIELRYHPLIPNRTCHVNLETLEGDCPIFKDIRFEDITVANATRAGDINGFLGDPLYGLAFNNVTFADLASGGGWQCGYTDLASFSAVDVRPPLTCSSGSGSPTFTL